MFREKCDIHSGAPNCAAALCLTGRSRRQHPNNAQGALAAVRASCRACGPRCLLVKPLSPCQFLPAEAGIDVDAVLKGVLHLARHHEVGRGGAAAKGHACRALWAGEARHCPRWCLLVPAPPAPAQRAAMPPSDSHLNTPVNPPPPPHFRSPSTATMRRWWWACASLWALPPAWIAA